MWIGKEAVSNPLELGRWKEACRGAVILAKVLIYLDWQTKSCGKRAGRFQWL